MESFWLVSTITGERRLQVFPNKAGRSWENALNVVPGWGAHSFNLGDRRLSRDEWRELTTSRARMLVQCWNDRPVYAGMVLKRRYNKPTKTLTLSHRGIRSIFTERYPFGVNSYWADVDETIPGSLLIPAGLTARAAIARVLNASITGPTAFYGLQLVLPSTTEVGSEPARPVENFTFRLADTLISELQSTDGGPDVDFRPEFAPDGTLRHRVRVGSPAELRAATFEWNLTAKDCPATLIDVDEDATNQRTGVFGVGQGSGPNTFVGGTPDAPAAEIPAADAKVQFPNDTSSAQASSHAREHLAAHNAPTIQCTVTVNTVDVDPSSLVLGSRVRLYEQGDPWLYDGWKNYRLIGLAAGSGKSLTLTVQGERA